MTSIKIILFLRFTLQQAFSTLHFFMFYLVWLMLLLQVADSNLDIWRTISLFKHFSESCSLTVLHPLPEELITVGILRVIADHAPPLFSQAPYHSKYADSSPTTVRWLLKFKLICGRRIAGTRRIAACSYFRVVSIWLYTRVSKSTFTHGWARPERLRNVKQVLCNQECCNQSACSSAPSAAVH